MDNINVKVKSKNPAVEPKNLKELTAEIAEVRGTIDDIYESVEQSEQDIERLNEAYNNSDDFIIGPDNKMKRKPKAYAPAEYSGLGEIYLDKNMKFLGREFEEFVSNPNVPHPGESIGDPDGIVYDRVRQAFLGYRNIEGSRMYTDTWDEQADYTAASGYKYLCTSTDTAYKWQNGDLVETAAINGNVLTQAILDFEHTIYHIQYDYDLNGRTIEVPLGCVLQFEGGSLRNGTLVGDDTVIKAEKVRIMSDVILRETWKAKIAYLEWFDAKSDCVLGNTYQFVSGTNNVVAFRNLFLFNDIEMAPGTYYIEFSDAARSLFCVPGARIKGNNAVLKFKYYNKYLPSIQLGSSGSVTGYDNIELSDLTVIGWKQETTDVTEWVAGVEVKHASNVTLRNVISMYNRGDGFTFNGGMDSDNIIYPSRNVIMQNCKALYNHRQGLSITAADGVVISDCEFAYTSGTAPQQGIDIEPNWKLNGQIVDESVKNITISNCRFIGNIGGNFATWYATKDPSHITNINIYDCYFKGYGIILNCCDGVNIDNCLFEEMVQIGIDLGVSSRDNITVTNIQMTADSSFMDNSGSVGIYSRLLPTGVTCYNMKLSHINITGFRENIHIVDTDDNFLGIVDGVVFEDIRVECGLHNFWVGSQCKNVSYKGIRSLNRGKYPDGTSRGAWGWTLRQNDDFETRRDLDNYIRSTYTNNPTMAAPLGNVLLRQPIDGVTITLKVGDSPSFVGATGGEWLQSGILHRGLVGTTENRPSYGSAEKMFYYDTDLNRIIFWNGTSWIDYYPTLCDGKVRIAYYKSNGLFGICRPSSWNNSLNRTPIGLLIMEGEDPLVISLTEFMSKFSTNSAAIGTSVNTYIDALAVDGVTQNTTLLNSLSSDADAAVTKCAAFSKLDSNSHGIPAGSWRLPSAAEMEIIQSNKNELMYALAQVGGTSLWGDYHTCLTYYSMCMIVSFPNYIYDFAGKKDSYRVRPVSNLSKFNYTNLRAS